MNERIKELERQAEKFVMGIPASLDINEYTSVFNEKFAELIVRECMELAMNEKSRYASLYNKESDANKYLTMLQCATSMGNYRLLLKEHFGVKE